MPRRALAILTFACGLVACARGPDPEECNQLLDRYTALLLKQQRPEATDDEVERAQRAARTRAAADRHFAQCGSKLSRAQWECAMKAPSVDEVERCVL